MLTARVLWVVLAGFLLGFAASTIWEWFYFRGKRLASGHGRVQRLEAELQEKNAQIADLQQSISVTNRDSVRAPGEWSDLSEVGPAAMPVAAPSAAAMTAATTAVASAAGEVQLPTAEADIALNPNAPSAAQTAASAMREREPGYSTQPIREEQPADNISEQQGEPSPEPLISFRSGPARPNSFAPNPASTRGTPPSRVEAVSSERPGSATSRPRQTATDPNAPLIGIQNRQAGRPRVDVDASSEEASLSGQRPTMSQTSARRITTEAGDLGADDLGADEVDIDEASGYRLRTPHPQMGKGTLGRRPLQERPTLRPANLAPPQPSEEGGEQASDELGFTGHPAETHPGFRTDFERSDLTPSAFADIDRREVDAPDTISADIGPADTGLTDTGLTDMGLTDTGLTDTGLTDTGLTVVDSQGMVDPEIRLPELPDVEVPNLEAAVVPPELPSTYDLASSLTRTAFHNEPIDQVESIVQTELEEGSEAPDDKTVVATAIAQAPAKSTGATGAAQSSNRQTRLALVDEYPDDLAKIKGIGRVFRGRLYAEGICTWHELAESTSERLGQITRARTNDKIESWKRQAVELAQRNNREGAVYNGATPDDLEKIDDVSPTAMQRLYQLGIVTYRELGKQRPGDLRVAFDDVTGVNPDTILSWVHKAQEIDFQSNG